VIELLQNEFKTEEIGHMTCLGRCHENSAFHFAGKNYSGKSISSLREIVQATTDLNKDEYAVNASGKAILTKPFTTVESYYAPLKKILSQETSIVLDEIKRSGLRGRGGAGFPIGSKLEFCKAAKGEIKFIICNADEGDPGAYSDRYLLEKQPHSVLFGMLVSGFITGAKYGVIYIRAEYPEAAGIVQEAIDQLRKAGLIGENILGSQFSFDFKIIRAQGSYICGEETALINSIEGQDVAASGLRDHAASCGSTPVGLSVQYTLASCELGPGGLPAVNGLSLCGPSGPQGVCARPAASSPPRLWWGLRLRNLRASSARVMHDPG
jgi:NADH-quinone oxidoreductase subunit F